MSLRLRRGLEADRTSITPDAGEPIYTTDTKKLYIGDGSTPGGVEISGSGTMYLSGLTDVDITGVQHGYILQYNSGTSTWDAVEFTGGSGGATNLSGLTDTNLTGTVLDGQVLAFSGGSWIAKTNPVGVTDHGLLTGLEGNDHPQYRLTGDTIEISEIDAFPSIAGDMLISNGSELYYGTVGHDSLTGLTENDHPQYALSADLATVSGDLTTLSGEVISVHSGLTGLDANDHPQYALTGGNVEFSSVTTNELYLNTGHTELGHSPGRLYYDSNNYTVSLDLPAIGGGTGYTTLQLGQENYILAYNNTGSDIENGQIVYISGVFLGLPTMDLANASAASTACPCGMATQTITNGSFGYITTQGWVRDVNTAGYSIGDSLYLSTGTSGGYTNVPPMAPNYRTKIGIVVTVNANTGIILFNPKESGSLSDLSDINGTTPDATNKYLVWNDTDSYWDANQIYFSGITDTGHTHDFSTDITNTGHTHDITEIVDYPQVIYTATTFVSLGGDDVLGDGSIENPYRTIQKGIDESSSGDTVYIFGGGEFTEGITGSQGINVYAPNIDLKLNDGTQLVLSPANYTFDKITRESGSGPMVISQGLAGYANVQLSEFSDSGSGNSIENNFGGILDVDIDQVYVRNGGFGSFLVNGDTGNHIHLNARDLYLASSGATAIKLISGGTVLCNIQHVKEIQNGTGSSIAFDIQDGDLNIQCEDLTADKIAIIGDNGNLNLFSPQATGEIVNTGSGIFNSFVASKEGRTLLQSNLGIDQVAPSYSFVNLSGSAGSYLTIGSNGALVPVELNVGQVVWEDTGTTVTTLDSTGTEILLYELTIDQEFDAGSWEYEVDFDIPYFRETTVRFYCGTTLLSTVTENSSVDPLIISDAGSISSTVPSGTVFSATVETDVAPAFVPNRTTVTDGFIRVTKTGSEANAEWGSISGDITGQTDLYTAFLAKNNTDVFTPTGDYEPATKKYVDDNAGGGTLSADNITPGTFPGGSTGAYKFNSGTLQTAGSGSLIIGDNNTTHNIYFYDGGIFNHYLRYNGGIFQFSDQLNVPTLITTTLQATNWNGLDPSDLGQQGASLNQILSWDGSQWSPEDPAGYVENDSPLFTDLTASTIETSGDIDVGGQILSGGVEISTIYVDSSQLTSHTADTTIHFTESSIDIANITSAHTHTLSEITDSGHTHGVWDSKSTTFRETRADEDSTLMIVSQPITVISALTVSVGTSPSTTWSIKYGSDRSAVGTTLATSTSTSTTSIEYNNINTSVPVGNIVWIETSATGGTVNEFHLTMIYSGDTI